MAPSAARLAATTASAAGLLIGGLAYAAFYPRSQIFGRSLIAPRRPWEIALTFDDGPNPDATPRLLDTLARAEVRATFFLIGRYALAQPGLTRRIAAAGHLLGSHTMTHPKLPLCGHDRIRTELRDSKDAIEDIIGAPIRYFRAPHGARTSFVLTTARELGLTTVAWNLIGRDWTELTADGIVARVEQGIARNQRRGDGSNIVLHDGSQTTPKADRSRTLAATATLLTRHTANSFITLDAWES